MAYQQSKSGRSQQRVCKVPQESKDLLWFFSKPLLWSFWGPVNGFRNSFLSVWPAIEKCQPISVFYFGSSQPHMVDSLFLYQLFNILILEKCEKKEPLYRPPLWSSSDFTINRRIIFSTGVEWYDVVFHIFCGYFIAVWQAFFAIFDLKVCSSRPIKLQTAANIVHQNGVRADLVSKTSSYWSRRIYPNSYNACRLPPESKDLHGLLIFKFFCVLERALFAP